jgi:hypothetical protein
MIMMKNAALLQALAHQVAAGDTDVKHRPFCGSRLWRVRHSRMAVARALLQNLRLKQPLLNSFDLANMNLVKIVYNTARVEA